MPQRSVTIAGIGEVVIYRRRRSSHLRLSVTNTGKVRVGMPYWAPYSVGVVFARKRIDWITRQVVAQQLPALKSGDRIGKAYQLYFYQTAGHGLIKTRVSTSRIEVFTSLAHNSPDVQTKAYGACERALKREAQQVLPSRLRSLANQHKLAYRSVRIRKLTSRWGSCSNDQKISLSYYLTQLPQQLIDYVLLHELIHTRHLHHGNNFWLEFEKILPEARQLRKIVRDYKPRVEPA